VLPRAVLASPTLGSKEAYSLAHFISRRPASGCASKGKGRTGDEGVDLLCLRKSLHWPLQEFRSFCFRLGPCFFSGEPHRWQIGNGAAMGLDAVEVEVLLLP